MWIFIFFYLYHIAYFKGSPVISIYSKYAKQGVYMIRLWQVANTKQLSKFISMPETLQKFQLESNLMNCKSTCHFIDAVTTT